MKRHLIAGLLLSAVLFTASSYPAQTVWAQERAVDIARKHGHNLEERYQPAGSIITEVNTGQILWEENAQISWAPASMTKLMTVLVAYDAMAEGLFSLETQVEVTDKYLDIAGRYVLSNNKMKAGASYTVSELIDLIIVPSSAAATYMLADLVEPDHDRFVERMNQKAAALGMTNTVYYNGVGVPNYMLEPYHPVSHPGDSNNMSSPEDYALLCSYFVKTYPDILNHTKHPSIVVKQGTPYEEQFDTYQISVEGAKYGLAGTDGLKTGSSGDAGFNYSSTAKRGDTRFVEIVMGVSDWSDQTGEEMRHLVGNAIMEETFAKYEYRKVLSKGTHTINDEQIEIENDFWDCVPKDQEITFELKEGKVRINQERRYLPGYEEPRMSYKPVSELSQVFGGSAEGNNTDKGIPVYLVLAVVSVLGIAAVSAALLLERRRRQLRRMRRRRRKG